MLFCRDILDDPNIPNYQEMQDYPHGEISRFLDDPKKRKKLVLMPRNSFKSTEITINKALHAIVKNPNVRILIDSETYSNSIKYLAAIKAHMEQNQKFIDMFGNLGDKGGKSRWTTEEITVTSRTNIGLKEPTVSCSSIDTVKVGMHYDLIIGDDLVSKTNSNTREQIAVVREHIQLLFSLLDPQGWFYMVGTRWSMADAYSWIIEELGEIFDIYIKSAYEPEGSIHGKLLLPKTLTEDFLNMQRKIQGSFIFSCQYKNDPISEENAPFKRDDAQFYINHESLPQKKTICMAIDPAISTGADACHTAIAIGGMDSSSNLYVLDHWSGVAHPHEVTDRIFAMYSKWKPAIVGIEAAGYQKFLIHHLNDKMRERNIFMPIQELKGWTTDSKESRIMGMQGRWQSHALWLKKDDMDLLEMFLRYPRGKRIDLLDAIAYLMEVLYPPQRVIGDVPFALDPHLDQVSKSVWAFLDPKVMEENRKRAEAEWEYNMD